MKQRIDLTPAERAAISSAARGAGRRWRITPGDIEQELWVWALENLRTLARYRDQENGAAKLGVALRRQADKKAAVEVKGCEPAPKSRPAPKNPEPPDQIKALLSVVWAPEEWPKPGVVVDREGRRIAGPDPEQVQIAWAMLHDLSNALMGLSASTRRLLWLRYRQGLSSQETADVLGMGAKDVDVRTHRAIAKLGRVLGDG